MVSELLHELDNVHFAHGARPVLNGIDLKLRPGRCHGILGPNGSGKTTLLDLLCGLLMPDRGEIIYAGRPLSRWPARALARQVALVPQEFAVRFSFTVRQVVEMGRYPYLERMRDPGPEDRAVVTAVMAELDIGDLADRPVTRLSGGEKQRVAVARALAQEPRVLLLDEATSNLDIRHTLSILGAIRRRVRDAGLCVVAALHDLNQAAMFCDRLLFLKKGRIFRQGPVAENLTEEVIQAVYGVEARVHEDRFSGCSQISFRLPENRSQRTEDRREVNNDNPHG